jgi:UDP-glucose 4-epimerase
VRYLVTGGAGFIGSHIVDRLINEGNEVVVIDNESATSNSQFYWNNKAENHKYDITEYDLIAPLFENVDIVFHLAAEARIQPATKNPIKAAKTNFLGTCTVLQCAREFNIKRFIYSSTSSSYGLKNTPPLQESMPTDCLNPYSVTKCAGEELCKMYYKLFGLETVMLRYFNVYGDRQPLKGEYATVIGLFLRQFKNGEPMTVIGDGTQRRDFTNITDVVEANIKAATVNSLDAFGEVFNIGCGVNYSILDLVKMIGGDFKYIPERIGETKITLADISKAERILGWKPRLSLESWLKHTLSLDLRVL